MPSASDDCNACMICCEAYTPTVRRRVECSGCGTACCASCLAQYVLSLQAEPYCMNNECKRSFDRDFLAMHLPKTWLLTKYKAHRERVLLDREMAMLPATQDALTNYKYAQNLNEVLSDALARRKALQKELAGLNNSIAHWRRELHTLTTSMYTRRSERWSEARERRQFVRACPMEGCRGFLSTAWKCGTCETWVCKDCGEPKAADRDEQHECDEGVKASFALLQRDSRPCPQCASMIFKIDGCDQMFCTQCHVAFSWRTGAVVTNGVIHNPHYYAWLRQTRGEVPRNQGDLPCGGAPDAYELERTLRARPGTQEVNVQLRLIHRVLRHVQLVDLPRLRDEARADAERNVDLRLAYLLNRIGQDEWRRKLQQREKKRERAFAVMQVYDMFCDAAGDMYRALTSGSRTGAQCLADLRQLQSFADETLARISTQFNMRVKRLRE